MYYLDSADKETESTLDERRPDQGADLGGVGDVVRQPRRDPPNLDGKLLGMLRLDARGNHGGRRHPRVCAVQMDQAHVVVHPDAGHGKGAVLQRRPKGRIPVVCVLGAQGLELGPELGSEDLKRLSKAFPLTHRRLHGNVGVEVFWHLRRRRRVVSRRAEAHGQSHLLEIRQHAREHGR